MKQQELKPEKSRGFSGGGEDDGSPPPAVSAERDARPAAERLDRPVCDRITVQVEKKVTRNYQSRAMSFTETWTLPPTMSDTQIETFRADRIDALTRTMRERLPSEDQAPERRVNGTGEPEVPPAE